MTYQTLNKGETRAVELTIRTEVDGLGFVPQEVTTTILDSNDNEIVAEQVALFQENRVYVMVGPLTTGNIGEYKIKWKIIKSGQTYFHITNLTVVEL